MAVLFCGRIVDKYGYVSVYLQCAGAYGPMSLDKGPNKGQGPLDGAPIGSSSRNGGTPSTCEHVESRGAPYTI